MARISSFDRNQSVICCFEDFIKQDNPVRLIDAFVNSLDLKKLGFTTYQSSAPGQQPYSRSDLLKLHLFGYVNGIRSSRKLADACHDSISLMWLVNGITPSKSLISDFIKVNETAICNTFQSFVDFLVASNFIDGKVAVIDGTKIRAQNSRNKFYSKNKIDATIAYFNSKIAEYTSKLKDSDSDSPSDPNSVIPLNDKISDYEQRIKQYSQLRQFMTDNNLSQITITDPDSRMMSSHGKSDISYNLQTSVDSKHSLITAVDVVNDVNDTNQLENMVNKTTDALGRVADAHTADKGYFNSKQIHNCVATGSKIFVKQPSSSNATNDSSFSVDKFMFDHKNNCYICPAGKSLYFTRALKKRKSPSDKLPSILGYEFFCSDCGGCPYLHQCTNSKDGRRITRNPYQDALDSVKHNFEEYPDMYSLRKCVVEHPFGTIKRSLGYTYFLRKGLRAVKTEAALICLAYNIKRLVNISNTDSLKTKLRDFSLRFITLFYHFLLFFPFSQKNHKFVIVNL